MKIVWFPLFGAISLACITTTTAFGDTHPRTTNAVRQHTVQGSAWKGAIEKGTINVSDGLKTQPVDFIRINTRDSHVVVEPTLAGHRLGQTGTLASLAASEHAIAAINGGFFRDYSDNVPESTVMMNGQFAHLWGPTIFGMKTDGTPTMARGQEALFVSFPHDWPNEIHAWGLNTWLGRTAEIEVLNPFYGTSTRIKNATSVVVENGNITAIQRGDTVIPRNGYVVEFGDGSGWNKRIVSKLQVGDPATMRVDMTDLGGNSLDDMHLTCAIGAGPLLVDGGRMVLTPKLEHLTDPSLLNPVTRRSFLGIDAKGNLIFAVVRFANVPQLAKIAFNMHLKEAMNLDGGSSSGLYFNGQYILSPGRKLADALTVSYR